MGLEQLYYIGELVGVVVVIGSLLFVGIQMRQSANALRVSTTAAAVANWQATVLELAGGEHVAPAIARVNQATDPSDLDTVDVMRITGFLIAAAKNTEFAFFRHQANEIADGLWEAARNGLLVPFRTPITREVVWPRVKMQLSPEFASFFEKELNQLPGQSFSDLPQSFS